MKNQVAVVVGFVVVLVAMAAPAWAQKLPASIVDRQDFASNYTYVVPGHLLLRSDGTASCWGGNCVGSTTTTGSMTSSQSLSYDVSGTTLTLGVPDGRIVVVNCAGKPLLGTFIAASLAGLNGPPRTGRWRSCRTPPTDNVQVTFSGDNAKLSWPVSLDGKKSQTEIYKVLAVHSR